MRTLVLLKSIDGGRERLVIELELDHVRTLEARLVSDPTARQVVRQHWGAG